MGVFPSTLLLSPEQLSPLPEPKHLTQKGPFIFNPCRCSKRQVVFPRTPNLLNPSSVPPQFTGSSVLASTDTVALEMISTPTSDIFTVANEAFIKVMEAVYAKKHF